MVTQRILERANRAILRADIRLTRSDLDKNAKELFVVHLRLSYTLHPLLFDKMDCASSQHTETARRLTIKKQVSKFDRLYKQQHSSSLPSLDVNKIIYNQTDEILDDATMYVLIKGFNYAVTPQHIPTEEIICNVEAAIQTLPSSVAEEIRAETARTIRLSQPPCQNISGAERKALRELQES